MTEYANLNGNSNVKAFSIGDDYIVVEFNSGQWTVYTYTYASAGSADIEQMKSLAVQGSGLNSFIGKNKPAYASKK